MNAKKHSWVDYLACLIFGAVIMPLYYFGRNYPHFFVMDLLVSVVFFAGIYVVCFFGVRLFLKENEEKVFVLYCFWGAFWFLYPIARMFLPFFYNRLFFHYRWFLMVVSFIVFLVMLVLLRRRLKRITFLIEFFGKFVWVLFVFLLFQACKALFLYHCFREEIHANVEGVKVKDDYPNIYHILLDAHPSREGFEQLGGDLKPFYRELEHLGFITYARSKSVYSDTLQSVSAMWHMDAGLYSSLEDSVVLKTLRRAYAFRMYGSDAILRIVYPESVNMRIYRVPWSLLSFLGYRSVFRPVYALLAWCFLKPSAIKSHRFVFRSLQNGRRLYGSSGNFFYGHILSPHTPFVYSKGFNFTVGAPFHNDSERLEASTYYGEEYRSLLRNEVDAIDNLALKTIKEILREYSESGSLKPIIILHSDHGSMRETGYIGKHPLVAIDTCFGNLFAVYMPQEWKKMRKI